MRNARLQRTIAYPLPWARQCKLAFSLVLVLFFLTPALWAQRDVHAQLIKPSLRAKAQAFQLMGQSGSRVKLSHFRGKVILLNFWATECGGCVIEVPELVQIERAFRHDDFTVVGVNMDMPYGGLKTASEAWKQVRPFVASHRMNYPVLMGNLGLEHLYRINAYPASFIIDKSGRIAARYVGIVNKDNVEANVTALLGNK